LLVHTGDLPGYRVHREALLARFGSTSNAFAAWQTARSCLFLPLEGEALTRVGQLAEFAVVAGTNNRGTFSERLHQLVAQGGVNPRAATSAPPNAITDPPGRITFEERLHRVLDAAGAASPTNAVAVPNFFHSARRADLMLTRALVEYRAGRFPEAERWISQSFETLGTNSFPALVVAARSLLAMTLQRQQRMPEAQAALAQAAQRADDALPRLENGKFGATWEQTLTAYIFLGEARELMRNPPVLRAR
jgi:tetratricopeptide (TPR) repeat protein